MNNKCQDKIMELMGFPYVEENVCDEDEYSMPTMYTFFTEVPMQVKIFNYPGEIPEKHVDKVQNPDFGLDNPKKWNNEIEFLSWLSLNKCHTREWFDDLETNADKMLDILESISKYKDGNNTVVINLKPGYCEIRFGDQYKQHWEKEIYRGVLGSWRECIYRAIEEFIEFIIINK